MKVPSPTVSVALCHHACHCQIRAHKNPRECYILCSIVCLVAVAIACFTCSGDQVLAASQPGFCGGNRRKLVVAEQQPKRGQLCNWYDFLMSLLEYPKTHRPSSRLACMRFVCIETDASKRDPKLLAEVSFFPASNCCSNRLPSTRTRPMVCTFESLWWPSAGYQWLVGLIFLLMFPLGILLHTIAAASAQVLLTQRLGQQRKRMFLHNPTISVCLRAKSPYARSSTAR